MTDQTIELFPNQDFGLAHNIDYNPNLIHFSLHNHHDIYEVLLFLSGDCEFYVEGNVYPLNPYDLILTRPFELHHITCKSDKPYERIILHIKLDFFKRMNCFHLADVFENRELGVANHIDAHFSSKELSQCLGRLVHYSEEKAYDVVKHSIIEFLYLLNQTKKSPEHLVIKDPHIRSLIVYINNHLADDLNLDILSKQVFITKFHMCKLFKAHTGHTINQYINYKRLLLAQDYHNQGQSFLEASSNAGFNNYSTFYRSYLKHFGHAPSDFHI